MPKAADLPALGARVLPLARLAVLVVSADELMVLWRRDRRGGVAVRAARMRSPRFPGVSQADKKRVDPKTEKALGEQDDDAEMPEDGEEPETNAEQITVLSSPWKNRGVVQN